MFNNMEKCSINLKCQNDVFAIGHAKFYKNSNMSLISKLIDPEIKEMLDSKEWNISK